MNETGVIYRIKNEVNGKCYIGQTISGLTKRWNNHRRNALGHKASSPLYSAIRKYGAESFSVKVIIAGLDRKQLDETEKYLIDIFQSKAPHGYNVADGGLTSKITESGRERLRQGMTRDNPMKNPDTARQAAASRGKHTARWWIGKNNPVHQNHPMKNLAVAAKTSKALKGRKKSKETCRRLSESLKGKTPWNKGTHRLKAIPFGSKSITIGEIIDSTDLPLRCIWQRIALGWTAEKILVTPLRRRKSKKETE